MEKIIEFVSYLALISISAERFTDIIKRAFLEKRNVNGSVYQFLTFMFGVGLALHDPIQFKLFNFNEYVTAILIGLATSGGSSVWHDMLETLNNFSKETKKLKTNE